jgi:NitT/TauT family transport system ATP-binding protein
MDEPFAALDSQTRILMQQDLLELWHRERKTVLFVTHDVREAVYLAERVAVMGTKPGRIKAIIDTNFPDKGHELDTTEEFSAKCSEIWQLLRADVVRHE